jgi:hypothetical protein
MYTNAQNAPTALQMTAIRQGGLIEIGALLRGLDMAKHSGLSYIVLAEERIERRREADERDWYSLARRLASLYHAARRRCQYPQKSTLGLLCIARVTTRSTWTPFGSRR